MSTRIVTAAMAVALAATAAAHETGRGPDRPWQDAPERDANGCRIVRGGDGVAGAAASSGAGSASVGSSVSVGSGHGAGTARSGNGGVSVSAGGGTVSSSIGGLSITAGNGRVTTGGDVAASATGDDCIVVVPRGR